MTEPPSPLRMLLSRHTRMLLSRHTKRREFMTLLAGTTATWPLVARAQQTATRTIGWLSLRSADTSTEKSILAAFRQGLNQTGYVEGRNLTIEFRFADGRYDRLHDRLPALAATWCADKWKC